MRYSSPSRKVFVVINTILLIFMSFLCLFPVVHVLAVSLSTKLAAVSGSVTFYPMGFTLDSYRFILKQAEFYQSFLIAIYRTVIGVPVNMLLIILAAYPLSKPKSEFRFRNIYSWYFVLTILLSVGLIPLYMTIRMLGLIDNLFALILPTAVPVYSMLIVMNYFRSIPKEMSESAFLDGASHWRVLFQIIVPLSMPALATVFLFSMVSHWNSWFDGLIFMNNPKNYPLQSYLQTVVVQSGNAFISARALAELSKVSNITVKSAQLFVAIIPMMIAYPFIQKYFTKGIMLGAVKD